MLQVVAMPPKNEESVVCHGDLQSHLPTHLLPALGDFRERCSEGDSVSVEEVAQGSYVGKLLLPDLFQETKPGLGFCGDGVSQVLSSCRGGYKGLGCCHGCVYVKKERVITERGWVVAKPLACPNINN